MMSNHDSFESMLRRYFVADALTPASIAHLEGAWRALLADSARSGGIDLLFAPIDRVAAGLAWWEERPRGADWSSPVGDLDRACMLMSVDPMLDAPAARPYCPNELLGTWTAIQESTDGVTLRLPRRPRELTLGPGGALQMWPEWRGFGWRVHRGSPMELWIGPPRAPRTEIFLILRRDGDVMDVVPPGAWRGFERWRRR